MALSQAPGIINFTAPDEVQSLADLLSPDLIRQAFSLTRCGRALQTQQGNRAGLS